MILLGTSAPTVIPIKKTILIDNAFLFFYNIHYNPVIVIWLSMQNQVNTIKKVVLFMIRKLNDSFNVISDNLIKLRKAKHLSQADVANDLNLLVINIHKNDISKIEANARAVTDYELYGFAKVLGVSILDLLDGVESKLEK